jgi:hypothetical protein
MAFEKAYNAEAVAAVPDNSDLDFSQVMGTLRVYLLVEVPYIYGVNLNKTQFKRINVYRLDYVSKETAQQFIKEFRNKNHTLSIANAQWQANGEIL